MTDYNTVNSYDLLLDFEKASYSRDYVHAYSLLTSGILVRMEAGLFVNSCTKNKVEIESICTRFISAYIHFILDSRLNITDDGFYSIIKFHSFIKIHYEMSGFNGLINKQYISDVATSRLDQKKQLLLSLPALFERKVLSQFDDKYLVPYFITVLSSKMVVTEIEECHRVLSIDYLQKVEFYDIDALYIDRLSAAWMSCSYATIKIKHEVKKKFNKMLRHWLIKKGCVDNEMSEIRTQEKPLLVICAERMRGNHAMYRCYGASLASLQEYFRVVLVADKHDIDHVDYDWVDQTIRLDILSHAVDESVVVMVKNLNPDVILYPSLGMHYWTLPLAVMRIAPLQILLLGHPATSNSPMIDYVIVDEGALENAELMSERVVKLSRGSTHALEYPSAKYQEPIINIDSSTFNILISSSAMKLNCNFFDICKKIRESANKKVLFHFFPNVTGLALIYFKRKIEQLIGDDVFVYKSMPYDDYIGFLNSCDLMLSPFPFGGTNSNIDAIKQGIPVVCMDGDEAHSHCDAEMMARIGQPSWLTATTTQEYLNIVLRLVDDDEMFIKICEQLIAINVIEALTCSTKIEFGEVMNLIFNHHHQIELLGQHCYSLSELKNLVNVEI